MFRVRPPYFIAEISANHCGKLSIAKKLIKCAKQNGADAVKLQTYTPETMTINSNKKYFRVKDGLWKYYYLNGKLKMEGEYNGLNKSVEDWDVRCGVWKTYHKTGKLSNKLTYKNGEIV